VQVIKRSDQGWTKRSISHVLQVSRPTVDRWIRRFAAEQCAGLADNSRAPQAPARKVWFPLMIDVYHVPKRHPDAGELRLWSLLASTDSAVSTGGRLMALKKQVYDDIPHVHTQDAPKPPQPPPSTATAPHQFWCMDGRMLEVALDGVQWWSLIRLEGYARTMLAGAVAPAAASGVALMVLDTACLRYGAPEPVLSDSGGAFLSTAGKAVWQRLGLHQEPIKSHQGQSSWNWLETPCNIPRRLFDSQCA
jgi:hypothetical protein